MNNREGTSGVMTIICHLRPPTCILSEYHDTPSSVSSGQVLSGVIKVHRGQDVGWQFVRSNGREH